MISACGTGKTIIAKKTAYSLIHELNNSLIIIFMPTLTLVNQFNNVWSKKHPGLNFDNEPFVFCSDKSSLNESQKEISGIDLKKLKQFLENKSIKHKVILTTYQSSITLCNFFKYSNYLIDFGIFDEAHKTVGLEDKEFAHAIYDKNILIKKRLFMTATRIITNDNPYHQKLSRHGKVNLMDDIVTYGRVAYNLSMFDAIKKNIIKDFKLAIGVIDKDFIQKHKELFSSGKDFYSNVMAYSYIKALKEKNIKKSIIFNSKLKI